MDIDSVVGEAERYTNNTGGSGAVFLQTCYYECMTFEKDRYARKIVFLLRCDFSRKYVRSRLSSLAKIANRHMRGLRRKRVKKMQNFRPFHSLYYSAWLSRVDGTPIKVPVGKIAYNIAKE